MAASTRWIRLAAESAELDGFDAAAALASSRQALLAHGVEPLQVGPVGPGWIDVVLVLPETVTVDDIASRLRAALALGPGGHEMLDPPGPLRMIGGIGSVCECGGVDGDHFPGCPLFRHRA